VGRFRLAGNDIYVLEYGFDERNNTRIGLHPHITLDKRVHKSILFTNYGVLQTVNKRAGKLLYGTVTSELSKGVKQNGDPRGGMYWECSTRNVYDALEMDFAALEEELLAGTPI
jgi:hypothetical protein